MAHKGKSGADVDARNRPSDLDDTNYWSGSYDGAVCHDGRSGNYHQDRSLPGVSMEDLKRGFKKGG